MPRNIHRNHLLAILTLFVILAKSVIMSRCRKSAAGPFGSPHHNGIDGSIPVFGVVLNAFEFPLWPQGFGIRGDSAFFFTVSWRDSDSSLSSLSFGGKVRRKRRFT
jgi:hypothetical protein